MLNSSYGKIPFQEKTLEQDSLEELVGDLFDLKVQFASIDYELEQIFDATSKDREIYMAGLSHTP